MLGPTYSERLTPQVPTARESVPSIPARLAYCAGKSDVLLTSLLLRWVVSPGLLGPIIRDRVRRFRDGHGPTPDGTVGSQTWPKRDRDHEV